MDADRLFDLRQAAVALGTSVAEITASADRGDLRVEVLGADHLVTRAEIERFRAARRGAGTRAAALGADPLVTVLTARQRQVLDWRAAGLTFAEIGRRLGGVTRQRVQQVESAALRKLGQAARAPDAGSRKLVENSSL